MTATAHYLEPLSNRIRSRNDNAAKPNQLSWLSINLSLQWPIVEGHMDSPTGAIRFPLYETVGPQTIQNVSILPVCQYLK
jgi:hypothetical protein